MVDEKKIQKIVVIVSFLSLAYSIVFENLFLVKVSILILPLLEIL